MSGYLYKEFISYLYNTPLIILIYSLITSFIVLNINKVKSILYIIITTAILSLTCCLYTNNLLYFLLGIELYSLLYLVLLYNTSRYYNLLIALRKLSLLSMIISSIIIFGTTLVFLENNNLYFYSINIYNQFSKLGLGFILIGILFKLCVFPFHIWILDIYKNSPYYILIITECFFKLIILMILLKFISIFSLNKFSNIFLILGTITMFLSIILSIKENNIKRFFGLFNISHIGLILLLLSINNTIVYISVFNYLLMYSTCLLCFLLAIKDKMQNFRDSKHNMEDCKYLAHINNNIRKLENNKNLINETKLESHFIQNNKSINNTSILNNNKEVCIKKELDNNINKNNLIIAIISLLAMLCIPPFHTFLAKVYLILVILRYNEYTVLILSTMYFIIEITVIIIKMRFFKYQN